MVGSTMKEESLPQAFERGGGGASAELSRANAKSLSKAKNDRVNSNAEASTSGHNGKKQSG